MRPLLRADNPLSRPQAIVDGKTTVNLPCSVAGNEITVEAPVKSSIGDENWLYLA
ncbi:hypothetical protein [Paenibacillus anseongense]|uniref:hypothetical protein n=1 Tax=Paenibacillus anseongense TaxID=2682845 RepID=UPI001624A669|nr:hypothetical protein [Paenibacillus anseongense]